MGNLWMGGMDQFGFADKNDSVQICQERMRHLSSVSNSTLTSTIDV